MKLLVEIENEIIECDVIFRKRKTISIKIQLSGIVTIISPKGVKKETLKEIVKSKSKWILEKLSELEKIDKRYMDRKYIDGDKFLYLGKEYTLNIIIDKTIKKPKIQITSDKLCIITPQKNKNFMKDALEKWYRLKCKENIEGTVKRYKNIVGKDINNIRIKEQKKRWGSCSSKKNLNFNWRCVMAPQDVIDYIVVHELCHLVHMDHSERFWKLVERILPNYKEKKEWLRQNGVKMNIR